MPDFEAELVDLVLTTKVTKGSELKMSIRGEEIIYSRNDQTVSHEGIKMKLINVDDTQEFRILVDRASIEIFCNRGERALFLPTAIDRSNKAFKFISAGGKAEIIALDIYALESVWE
jgi:sucrose-6-phosphate hydrolase SacC (GH32 family)